MSMPSQQHVDLTLHQIVLARTVVVAAEERARQSHGSLATVLHRMLDIETARLASRPLAYLHAEPGSGPPR